MSEELERLQALRFQDKETMDDINAQGLNQYGEPDAKVYNQHLMDVVHDVNNPLGKPKPPGQRYGGFYLLPNIGEKNDTYDGIREIMLNPGEGWEGTMVVKDAKEDKIFDRTKDQILQFAVENSYPAIFKAFTDGPSKLDASKELLHSLAGQLGYKGIKYYRNAVQEASKMLWGGWNLIRNGGFTNPNGIGTAYRRSKLKEYSLDEDKIDNHQFNAFYRPFNVHGKQLRFFIEDDYRNSNKRYANSTLDQVIDAIEKGEGNIWIATVNDVQSGGYRQVLMAQHGPGDRDEAGQYMHFSPFQTNPNVQVLANLLVKPEDINGTWEPLVQSEDEHLTAIAEAEAYKHLDAHMDSWDQWSFMFNQTHKVVSMFGIENPMPISLIPYIPGSNFWSNAKLMMEDAGLMTPGKDLSRKRVKHYMENFGPGTDSYKDKSQGLASNILGLGHDISDPRRLDMDLVWIPIWNKIQEWEARQRREGKTDEAPEAVIAGIFEERRREMFSGRIGTRERRVFSAYDAIQFKPFDTVDEQFSSTYQHYNPPPGGEYKQGINLFD